MTNDKPVFIYLDQNKWIDLARAYNNRPDGKQFKSVLQKVTEAVESKKAIFPLSAFHIAETKKNAVIFLAANVYQKRWLQFLRGGQYL